MPAIGVAPQLELQTNGKIKLDLFKWLPFIISLIVFIGGYYALRQEVADIKESVTELKQDIRDLRHDMNKGFQVKP